ncbi:hypothetical protein INT43_005991 [Umbelopsis isabellina]|uniref:Uncharacterized protein n=1 Tax=Mortierella isabellina TaxID=91625 RepID=A0A8H7PIY5_MORIS|nr:hypothetical protein INT43_005991 [Umbelopsis isabellina]
MQLRCARPSISCLTSTSTTATTSAAAAASTTGNTTSMAMADGPDMSTMMATMMSGSAVVMMMVLLVTYDTKLSLAVIHSPLLYKIVLVILTRNDIAAPTTKKYWSGKFVMMLA